MLPLGAEVSGAGVWLMTLPIWALIARPFSFLAFFDLPFFSFNGFLTTFAVQSPA